MILAENLPKHPVYDTFGTEFLGKNWVFRDFLDLSFPKNCGFWKNFWNCLFWAIFGETFHKFPVLKLSFLAKTEFLEIFGIWVLEKPELSFLVLYKNEAWATKCHIGWKVKTYFLPSEKIRQGLQILILLNSSVKMHHF